MAVKMSSADEALIAKYKQDWANATTQAERDAAHANAEAVRAGYGYSGGADGSGYIVTGQSNAQNNAGTSKKYYTGSQPTYSTVGESAHNASKNAGYDANTDYSALLKQQMAAGASVNDVHNTLASRLAKANGNDGLQQYAWDDTTRQAINYLVTQQGGSLEGIDATAAAQATLAARNGDYTLWNELGLGNRNSGASGGASAGRTSNANGSTGAASSLGLTGMVADNSSYLEQLYAAKKAKALAELQAAYEQNVNAINRAGQGLEEQYQNARNQAAGASELAARNFAQYAAANGLNSGAGGQAELARNVALQNSLNGLDTAQASTLADLDLQRANAETNYNNAIAQAEAEGNYQLADALYQEKVRVQNAMMEAAVQERQSAFQQQQYADSLAQIQKDRLAEFGSTYLENGIMPSDEMLDAMGMTPAAAQTYLDMLFPSSVSTPVVDGGTPSISYNNGGLTADQVKALQAALGVNQDGYYGPASQSAAGGLNAEDAYTRYVGVEKPAGYQFAKSLYESTGSADYVYRTLKTSGYSDAEIDTLMALLGL